MRGIIAAVSPEGVIGVGGQLPWHYRADMLRFKELTRGTTVIMGRRTWESLQKKPLPERRNVVITRHPIDGVDCFSSLEAALAATHGDVWFIGGAPLYTEALQYADLIDLTYVPDHITAPDAVYFPRLDPLVWQAGPRLPHEGDPRLERQEFRRRQLA